MCLGNDEREWFRRREVEVQTLASVKAEIKRHCDSTVA